MKRTCAGPGQTLVIFLLLVATSSVTLGQNETSFASYRIGPMDLVSVKVLEDESLDAETRVTDAGAIELAHIDPVTIAGMTTGEAARTLAKALEKYLQQATVTVGVVEYRSQPITLMGAFRTPGTLPFSGRWTLIGAITQAGGLTENAGRDILVLRRASNGLSDQIQIDRRELLEHGNADVNITLLPNDLINVPVASDVTVFFIGEVANPGAIVFKSTDRITLLAALARAGGPTERASNNVIVRRPDTGDELRVSYKKLLGGSQADLELADGDLVIVKESFF